MMKSQRLSDILKAYNNIFPNGNDNFDKVIGVSNTTSYDDIGILCVSYDRGFTMVNSCSKDDMAFPIAMLKDIIRLAKHKDKMVLSTSRHKELSRFASQFGFIEIEIGFIKGVSQWVEWEQH